LIFITYNKINIFLYLVTL